MRWPTYRQGQEKVCMANTTYRFMKPSKCMALLVLFILPFLSHVLFSAELMTIATAHPHDLVIHGWYASDLAGSTLDNSGTTDVSGPLNTALENLFTLGGGTVYLPARKYRLANSVFVPPGTALRGDFVQPGLHEVDPPQNTIICAYYGRGMDAQSDPLFFLDGSSLIDGLVIGILNRRSTRSCLMPRLSGMIRRIRDGR